MNFAPTPGDAPPREAAAPRSSPEAATASPTMIAAQRDAGLSPSAPGAESLSAWRAAQVAHIAARLDSSEMRIALTNDALGPLDLRASVAQSRVGAAIAVTRPETQAALAGELPSLQQGLAERQLHLERFEVYAGSLTADLAAQGGFQQHGESFHRPQPAPPNATSAFAETASQDADGSTISWMEGFSRSQRLNVRA